MSTLKAIALAIACLVPMAGCANLQPGVDRSQQAAAASASASGNAVMAAAAQRRYLTQTRRGTTQVYVAPVQTVAALAPAAAPAAVRPTIADALGERRSYTIFSAAARAAGLTDVLSGPGGFTLFAPSNEAFDKLPAGTVETLLEREERRTLRLAMAYHIIARRVSVSDLDREIDAGGGQAVLTAVTGAVLRARRENGQIVLMDERGGMARLAAAETLHSNGIIQGIDAVLSPR